MKLDYVFRFGYAVVLVSFWLMVWTSLAQSKEIESVRYPPCYFNPLCSCSKAVPDLGIVKCLDIHMPRMPQTINSSKVFMLYLENNGLQIVEPYFLQSTGLYRLSISHNPITFIPDEAFIGLERSLWELHLSNNQLTHVPSRSLRYLQKLRLLDLTGNEISQILPDGWRGLEDSLQVMILAENSITFLPIDAFSGLPLLDTIDLRGNNLRYIDPAVFRDGMGRLAHINLADNQLTTIPYQALSSLKMLKTLDLSFNDINSMQPATDNGNGIVMDPQFVNRMSLDLLRLDYNHITTLETQSFQYFDVLNKTYLDGNPLTLVEADAFRQAKIRELYMRSCGLVEISPVAFGGLENHLQILDLSGNRLSSLPQGIFHRFDLLEMLSLGDNNIINLSPTETFNGLQLTVYKLDISGAENAVVNMQDLRRFRNLRSLSISRLPQNQLNPEDFMELGSDLEELKITTSNLRTIKNKAFQYVHGLKKLDLSENSINNIESDAFIDIGHSLISLQLSRALSQSVQNLPVEPLRYLTNLEELDLSNNKIRVMPDTSFHFLKHLKRLEIQDNVIDNIQKGTFQGDIHSYLEVLYLSFNNIKTIQQHTFTDLAFLEQLHLDDNKIDSLERRAFMNLRNLKRLNLKGNKISAVTFEAFQNLPELEDFDISYNQLHMFDFSIFDQVGTLSMFRVNASHNRIADLVLLNGNGNFGRETGSGGYHSNIKILDLSFNNITYIAKNYFHPAELSLTHLYLSHNFLINTTKDAFGSMQHLQWLDISHNRIYEIDFDSFRKSKHLQVLLASHNHIPEVPNDLFRHMENLRIVDLSHNRLRFLPDNVFSEEGLESLDLSHNQFTRLPLMGMSTGAASTLCELDLSWNGLSSIAHGGMFVKFRNLKFLDLSHNNLIELDAAPFGPLYMLNSLDLSHNSQLVLEKNGLSFQGIENSLQFLKLDNVSLSYVPELPLPYLISLSLSHNFLPSIPPEMAVNLSSLRYLNLAYNDLSSVPIVTHSLTELKQLSLAANPITALSNTSLLGVADFLDELDISGFHLNIFETGALAKMNSLRTLKISMSGNVRNFNLPKLLQFNAGLRNLEISVEKETDLSSEMYGEFPSKIKNITLTGPGLKTLAANVLQGIRSPQLQFNIINTELSRVPVSLFHNLGSARNISVNLRGNSNLKSLSNPSTGTKPGLLRSTFLIDLSISENRLTCDCDLGWIEVWQRKRRQYLCDHTLNTLSLYGSDDYICRHAEDDLRYSVCMNKNNQSLIEALKNDIECGWSAASTNGVFVVTYIVVVIGSYLLK